jgi:hypothetical protein
VRDRGYSAHSCISHRYNRIVRFNRFAKTHSRVYRYYYPAWLGCLARSGSGSTPYSCPCDGARARRERAMADTVRCSTMSQPCSSVASMRRLLAVTKSELHEEITAQGQVLSLPSSGNARNPPRTGVRFGRHLALSSPFRGALLGGQPGHHSCRRLARSTRKVCTFPHSLHTSTRHTVPDSRATPKKLR